MKNKWKKYESKVSYKEDRYIDPIKNNPKYLRYLRSKSNVKYKLK